MMIQLKLMTGEEIIGERIKSDDRGMDIRNALSVERVTAVGGAQFYTLKSWFLQQYTMDHPTDREVRVSRHGILSSIAPNQVTVDQYYNTLEYLKSNKDLIDSDEEDFDEDWGLPLPDKGRLN